MVHGLSSLGCSQLPITPVVRDLLAPDPCEHLHMHTHTYTHIHNFKKKIFVISQYLLYEFY